MANEYNRSSSAHLVVGNQSANSSKNLVRVNSVATLNQIYQHQNSIPVRNRILNTTKSLYNSVDNSETDIPAGHLEAGPILLPAGGTSAQRYLNPDLQFVRQELSNSSNYQAPQAQMAVGSYEAMPSAQIISQQLAAQINPTAGGFAQQHLMGAPVAAVASYRYHVNPQPIQQQQQQQPQNRPSSVSPIKIINVARRNKKTGQPSSREAASPYNSAALPSSGQIRVGSAGSWHRQQRAGRNAATTGTTSGDYSSSRNTWSSDSSSSCSSSHGASPLRDQSYSAAQMRAAGGRPDKSGLEVASLSRSPSPARKMVQAQAPLVAVKSQLVDSNAGCATLVDPIVSAANSTSPSHQASFSGASPHRTILPPISQAQQQSNPAAFYNYGQQPVVNVKRHRKLPQIPTDKKSMAAKSALSVDVHDYGQAHSGARNPTHKSLSSSSSASSTGVPITSSNLKQNGGLHHPLQHQMTMGGALARQQQQSHHLPGEPLRVLSFPMPAQEPQVGSDQRTPLSRASTLIDPPPDRSAGVDSVGGAAQLPAGSVPGSRTGGRQTLAALVANDRHHSASSGSADTASPRSPIGLGATGRGVSVHANTPVAKLSSSSSSSNSPANANNRPPPPPTTTHSQLASSDYLSSGHKCAFTFEQDFRADQTAIYEPSLAFGQQQQPPPASPSQHTSDWQTIQTANKPVHLLSCMEQQAQSADKLHLSSPGSSGSGSRAAGRGRRLSSCGSGLRANFLMNKQQAINEFTPPRSLESSNSRGSSEGQQQQQQHLSEVGEHTSGPTASTPNQWSARASLEPSGYEPVELAGREGRGPRNLPIVQVNLRRPSGTAGLPPRAASATEAYPGELSHGGELGGDLDRLHPVARSMTAMQSAAGGGGGPTVGLTPTSIGRRLAATLGGFTSALSLDIYHGSAVEPEPQFRPEPVSRQASGGSGQEPAERRARASLNLLEAGPRDRLPSNVSTSSMPPSAGGDEPGRTMRKFGAWAERIGAASALAGDQRLRSSGGELPVASGLRARSAGQLEAGEPASAARQRASLDRDSSGSLDSSSDSSNCPSSRSSKTVEARAARRAVNLRARRRLSSALRDNQASAGAAATNNNPPISAPGLSEELTLSARLMLAERSANELFRKVDLSPQLQSSNHSSNQSSNSGSQFVGGSSGARSNLTANKQQQQQQIDGQLSGTTTTGTGNAFFSHPNASARTGAPSAARSRGGEPAPSVVVQQDYQATTTCASGARKSPIMANASPARRSAEEEEEALILSATNTDCLDADEQADDLSLLLRSADNQQRLQRQQHQQNRRRQHLTNQSNSETSLAGGELAAAGSLATTTGQQPDAALKSGAKLILMAGNINGTSDGLAADRQNKSRLGAAESGQGGGAALGRRAAKVVRRAITLRSLVKTLSRSSGGVCEPAGPPSTSLAASPSRSQARPEAGYPHLVSVARADSARGQSSFTRPLSATGSTVRKLSGSLFGSGLPKTPRRALSALRAGGSREKAASQEDSPGQGSPVKRSLSLPRHDSLRPSSASSLRDASATIAASISDKRNNNSATGNNKRLDGMKSGK